MHITREIAVLYFGTPIVLISTVNEDRSYSLSLVNRLEKWLESRGGEHRHITGIGLIWRLVGKRNHMSANILWMMAL